MIHIDRNQVSPPDSLVDPGGPGAKETKEALEFFSNLENQGKSFPFKAYKGKDVVQALNQLFHHKCAYCESYLNFGATHPVDVEHFRPKGAVLVNGQRKGRGYYWLAARWDNLLPSCFYCNRRSTHEIIGQKAQVMGKGAEFPIVDESKRASMPGEENREGRLLLNPCLDNPDKHLVFEFEDDEVVLRPRISNGRESRMGRESIRVYALQRSELVQSRRDQLMKIRAQMTRIDRIMKQLDKNPEDTEIENWLKEEKQVLEEMQADDQPYAAMARQYVKNKLG